MRAEYKINTYERYLLISLRYHLSIHNIHKTHLQKLDNLANQHLKKWAGIPSRGCTNLALFHPFLMGLKTPSQLYLESHASNFLICKVKGDEKVNFALESQISRESQWSRKSSTVVECQSIMNAVAENHLIPTTENCYNFEASRRSQLPILKAAVRKEVSEIYLEKWNEATKKLLSQGDFLSLLISEKSNVSWKSVIHGVPKGVMQFAMRSSTNILATPDNLKRWKKTNNDNCKMCLNVGVIPSKATLFHI